MEYSRQYAKSLCRWFDLKDFKYDFDAEKGVLESGFPIPNSKLKNSRVIVRIKKNCVLGYSMLKINADEDIRPAVAEYITRANYGLMDGNFEMDFRDGELRYKVYREPSDSILTEDEIADLVILPLTMWEKYGDGLLAVMFGLQTPKEAIEKAEA